MKKVLLSLSLLMLFTATKAQFYKFDYFTETYEEFNDGTVINVDTTSADYYFATQSFKLFNEDAGDLFYVAKNGFVLAVNQEDTLGFAMDPYIAGLTIRDLTSSVRAKIESVNGQSVLKIQWKNMGLDGHDAGDYVNFQLWVYQDKQTVEFRYGPRNITGDAAYDGKGGPQIVLALLDNNFTDVKTIYAIEGSGGNPEALYNGFGYFTGTPDENLVMKFYNPVLSSVSRVANLPLQLYPNPAENLVTINGDFTGKETLIIVNTAGQEVMRIDAIENKRTFDIANLEEGVYFVKVVDVDTLHINKLVVSK